MSCKNLQIWKLSCELSIDIHKMSLEERPNFEFYETGFPNKKIF